MAVSLTHSKVSSIPDGADTSLVRPSDWNAEHTLTLAEGKVLGRTAGAGTGAAQELPISVSSDGSVAFSGTGATTLQSGTTAERPGTPATGMFRFNTTTGAFEGYSGTAWGSIGGAIVTSDTAPASPVDGTLWWDSADGQLYVYYDDGTSQQWVVANSFAGSTAYLPLTGGTVTGAVAFPAGSASTPSIIPAGDTNTGIFFPAADTIAFTEGGTEAMRINSDAQIVHVAGTASLPSVTFTGDLNTGIYSPGADRIGFTEGGTQVGEFDASGNLKFNSGYGSVATAYGCRAWINFNGQTSTPTINGSGNVSSITDLGAGQYTINMTTAMPDSNYCVTYAMGDISGVGDEHALISIGSSSAFTIRTSLSGDSWADANPVFCAVHR
jgi:hypothetical protein